MMPLRLMTTLTSTLQDGESRVANHIASHWVCDDNSVRFFRASANFLFTFQTEGQARYLRFNHEDERTFSGIEAEIDFLRYLAADGIRASTPIRSKAGNHIESIATEHGTFHAVVFEAIEGDHYELDDLTPDRFGTWGNSLGRLHRSAQKYCGTGRPTWEDQFTWVTATLPMQEEAARATQIKLTKAFKSLPILPHNFGLIHFDFELDNVVWNDDGLGILDFDDCAWYWTVADIAFAIRDLIDDQPDQFDMNDKRIASFLQGYQKAYDLSERELALIPLFLRAQHLITFTKLLRALNLEVRAGEEAWVTNLRQKLMKKVQQYREEFTVYAA